MSEVKDPTIKLFGKTIGLPETSAAEEAAEIGGAAESCDAAAEDDSSNQDPPCSSISVVEDGDNNRDAEDQESHKIQSDPKQDDLKDENPAEPSTSEELSDPNRAPPLFDDSKNEEHGGGMDNAQDKALKKPDKILPCPRCNSMDTKFCYFNNYNVNQPRHFCKNCQRYWTAGGTMRNVPVGAGRRKNKNAASQFRHMTIPEPTRDGIHRLGMHPNGTVLAFSSDSPLCESMVSALSFADKTLRNESRNGAHRPGEDDHSSGCGSSITAVSLEDEASRSGPIELPDHPPNCHPFHPGVPCFPGAPWPYPWPFAPARFPVPLYSTPPPYWTYSPPGSWNVPWVIPPTPTGPMSQTLPNSGPNSPTLGKHSRDDTILSPANLDKETRKDSKPEKCLWVPKTLRIDDLGEAAKSSIWATLGIKNDRVDSIGGAGLVKALQSQSKGDNKAKDPETSTILQANPAALSRSLNFHESL